MLQENITTVSDSLKSIQTQQSDSGAGWIMHHILDSREIFGLFRLPDIHLFGIDISITNHVVFMWLASIILILTFYFVSKNYKKSFIPKGLSNFAEVNVSKLDITCILFLTR